MKRMRFSVVNLIGAILVVFSSVVFAAPPSSVSYQGVLRTSAGAPVTDGSYDATFRLYTVPSGGIALWTETQPVTTSGGLFTCALGSTVSLAGVFSDNDNQLYLEITVFISGSPVTMSPRTPVLSVPYSASASSLKGTRTGSTTGTIRMAATPDSGFSEMDWDNNNDGTPESSIKQKSGSSGSSSVLHGMSGSTTGTIRMQATGDSAGLSIEQGAEVPGNHRDGWNVICVDGISEMTGRVSSGLPPGEPLLDNMRLRIDGLSSSVAINQKGTGADRNRVIMQSGSDGPSVSLLDSGSSVENGSINYRIVNDGGGKRADVLMRVPLNGLPPGEPVLDNIALSTNGTSSRLAIKTKGTSAHRSSATVETPSDQEAAFTLSHDDEVIKTFHWTQVSGPLAFTETAIDDDNDDDGDVGVRCDAIETRATLKTYFETGDVPTQSQITDTADASGARTGILSGMSGSTTATIRMQTTADSADYDLTFSDIPTGQLMKVKEKASRTKCSSNLRSISPAIGTDNEADISCDETAARSVFSGRSGSTTGTIRMMASPDTSRSTLDMDSNDDGVAEMSVVTDVTEEGSAIRLNGLPPGTPYIGNLTMQTNGPSSTVEASSRFGSGPRQTTSMDGSFDHAGMECKTDVDDDGNGDVGVSCDATEPRSTLKTYFETGDVPTESRSHVTHTTDADSAHTEMQTRLNGLPPGEPVIGTLSMTTTSSSSEIAIGDPGSNSGKSIGLHVKETNGECAMVMTDMSVGTPETTIVLDGHAKRFGIGVAQPDHPIEHSSGARLTAAGDWVNASSEKLKENFEAVNGAEVLEKIEDLSVTRWNYKADDDNVTHIGPTAEEFHDAFGIGESDKAISTIDPSGVALVAIKELSKRNKQLEKQNEQLQKQLQDLQKAVDKLVKQAEKSR